jgi:dihydrofolate reductase
VPIFVFTDKALKKRPKETDKLTFTFVTDSIESAVRRAKVTAGDKNVTIIGSANMTQQCIRAGLAGEPHIDVIPVFLKAGFRPFEDIGNKSMTLERIKVMELPAGRTHLRFRFVK